MKMQVLINVLCLHKNSMAMKLYFCNQDVKEIRAVRIYKDCLEVSTEIDYIQRWGRSESEHKAAEIL